MTGFVVEGGGQVWQLPELLEFSVEYGVGTPCDSFSVCCVWAEDNPTRPGDWWGFYAEEGGERVFTGVVDECEVSLTGRGRRLEVSGRGMAARLLDNEALGQDYDLALWEDIVADHIAAYGVEVLPAGEMPRQERFRVDVGSSAWTVLAQFLRAGGGRPIRFDRWGRLDVSEWEDGAVAVLDGSVPVTGLVLREKRYGALSEVLARDRWAGTVRSVRDEAFLETGGMARRVVTMAGRASAAELEAAGRELLETAARERREVEVTVALPFYAMPGELVELRRGERDSDGVWRVARSTVELDGDGIRTRMILREKDRVR